MVNPRKVLLLTGHVPPPIILSKDSESGIPREEREELELSVASDFPASDSESLLALLRSDWRLTYFGRV